VPGQRGSETRAMGRQVSVRMDEALAARVRAVAERDGVTDAAAVRLIVTDALGLPEEARPTARGRSLPPKHVLELARLREVVAELTGALVQAAIRTREAGLPVLHADIEAALPGVRAAVRGLDALKLAILADLGGAAR